MRTSRTLLVVCALLGAVPSIVNAITCKSCPRQIMCPSIDNDPPREVSRVLCGVYDNASPQNCTRTDKVKYVCPGAVGDPVTYGYEYESTTTLGYTCISGSDCY